MAVFVRIRAWRARRRDRAAEQLVALAAKDRADLDGLKHDLNTRQGLGEAVWTKRAGEEFKRH
jgi:hypothetical protein